MHRFIVFWSLGLLAIRFAEAEQNGNLAWEILHQCKLVPEATPSGDEFTVAHGDKEYRFRLYFVDAIEQTDTAREALENQMRYFAISESQVLDSGKAAVKRTRAFLKGEFEIITKWEDARTDATPSFFALAVKDQRYLSQDLVQHGLGRIYGIPTSSRWPGGIDAVDFLRTLKASEREAQFAKRGIWAHASPDPHIAEFEIAPDSVSQKIVAPLYDQGFVPLKSKINLNTATAKELESLPGIGPVYAKAIIEARPFEDFEALTSIPGISTKTVEGFRNQVVLADPPPPTKTARFYLADPDAYKGREVTVRIVSVTPIERMTPKGFEAVQLETANDGEPGGHIIAFIPDEFYESFLGFYDQSGREFTGLFHAHEGELVLVYTR